VQLLDAPDLVVTTVLSSYIESCVWSITQIDFQSVEQAIQSFNITVEIVSIFSVEITVILNRVISIACPGQPACSDQGSCNLGLCVCNTG